MASSPASPTPVTPSRPNSPQTGVAGWRVILRIFGALFALAIFAYWAAAGMNTGFYKDQIAIKKTDEITGIEYVDYQKHFVPGIEFLAAGTGLGLALVVATFFSRKKTHTTL